MADTDADNNNNDPIHGMKAKNRKKAEKEMHAQYIVRLYLIMLYSYLYSLQRNK